MFIEHARKMVLPDLSDLAENPNIIPHAFRVPKLESIKGNTFNELFLLFCISFCKVLRALQVLRVLQVLHKIITMIRSSDILRELNWDTLIVRRQKQKALLMFKVRSKRAPRYLTDLIDDLRLRDTN